ncbi:MAG: triphosphoribosyl-dephospho-CoA synthase CitG [Lachnospiraceae bacterium]|nr:triphosphoribosyl-dephospho-CoA synthase CitG [Lachnospiraceae bacterium]
MRIYNTAQIMINPVAESIGMKAWKALLEEVYTTPKPGLVDLYSCGAHNDMDITTFERSADALYPWFVHMAALGYGFAGSPQALFQKIRPVGILAEKAMYKATGGVNTHKGLIFTLGVFCAAAGRLAGESAEITCDSLILTEKQMTVSALTEELADIRLGEAHSNGEKNLHRYGSQGIRGEAIRGYPSVVNLALPVLREGIAAKRDWNRVKLQTLMVLMSSLEDSNILSRHDPSVLRQVKKEAEDFLSRGGAYSEGAMEELMRMDADYIRRNISAGGCADILAAAVFLEMLLEEESSAAPGQSRPLRTAAY